MGVGLIPDAETAAAWARRARRFTPNVQDAARYHRLSTLHDDAYRALHDAGVYEALSDFCAADSEP